MATDKNQIRVIIPPEGSTPSPKGQCYKTVFALICASLLYNYDDELAQTKYYNFYFYL